MQTTLTAEHLHNLRFGSHETYMQNNTNTHDSRHVRASETQQTISFTRRTNRMTAQHMTATECI